MLSQKYVIALIGEANDGKTTTINKAYRKMFASAALTHVIPVPGLPLPGPYLTNDFALSGNTKYGLTGIVSRGDVIYTLKNDLEHLALLDAM